jgi:hypothetical protein
MNCHQVTELKTRYLCAELDDSDVREFEAHLIACEECAETIAEEREIDECIRTAFLQDAPDTAALENRARSAIRRRAFRVPLIAGVAAAALVLVFSLSRPFELYWQNARLCDDAAGDHFAEIVRQDPRHWRSATSDIKSLAIQQGIKPSLLGAFASGEYRLERAKLCRLDGQIFLHAVYRNGKNRVSVYLRASSLLSNRPATPTQRIGDFLAALTKHRVGLAKQPIAEIEKRGEYIASFGDAGILAIVVANSSEQSVMSFARSAAMSI